MAMVNHQHVVGQRDRKSHAGIDLVSLAVLLVALVAIVLVLVGVAARGTTPLTLLPPIALGLVAILNLRK